MPAIVPIHDPDDDRLADYVSLTDSDLRRLRARSRGVEGDVLIAEGAVVVRHLLASRHRVRSLLVTERGLRALATDLDTIDAPVYLISQPLVRAVAGYDFHRGVLAAADRAPLPDPSGLLAGAGLLLLAEGVNDHENLGALFRNAAAFGADGVLLDPTSADPLYRRSIRVSMGHALRLPFTRMTDWPATIGRLQERGFEVLALTPDAVAEDVRQVQRRPLQAVLVGTEGRGLSPAALRTADRCVRIPLSSGVDSLNVATAAAILLHQLAPPVLGEESG